jgi:hypothetical protein
MYGLILTESERGERGGGGMKTNVQKREELRQGKIGCRKKVDLRLQEVKDLEELEGQKRLRASAEAVSQAMRGYVTAFPPDSRPPAQWRGVEQQAGVKPHALHPQQKDYHVPPAARSVLYRR